MTCKVWFSNGPKSAPFELDALGAGWVEAGEIPNCDTNKNIWRWLAPGAQGMPGPSQKVKFYLMTFEDQLAALDLLDGRQPVWWAADVFGDGQRIRVAQRPIVRSEMAKRPPESHPGLTKKQHPTCLRAHVTDDARMFHPVE